MRTRLVLLVGAVALLLGALAPPAGASVDRTYFIDDPQDVRLPRGDVLRLRLTHGPNQVVLLFDLRRDNDVLSWSKYEVSEIYAPLDTRGTAATDFFLSLENTGTVVEAGIWEGTPAAAGLACNADIHENLAHTQVRVVVPRTCLENPAELRARAVFRWDPDEDGDVDTTDRVPDIGFTPQVRRGS